MLPYLRGHKMLQPSGTIAVANYLPTKKSCHEPNDCQMRENTRYSRSTTIARWQQFEIDQESSQQPISEKKRDGAMWRAQKTVLHKFQTRFCIHDAARNRRWLSRAPVLHLVPRMCKNMAGNWRCTHIADVGDVSLQPSSLQHHHLHRVKVALHPQ